MADIETFILSDGVSAYCDYALAGCSLADAHDVKTAILISLFTDRRAEDDDILPDAGASKRGWWGDALSGRRIGSKLWLLSREKELNAVLARAEEYAREALAWMIDDGIASAVEVSAENPRSGWLGIEVRAEKASTAPEKYRFEFAWRNASEITH
ncbi:MAG: phage GP46 family protein [Candidatus Accumulibacter sp.]|jgi:phage gp46-like protein|nr:phage GP46 family protein [Accumulibacter sp.]